MSRNGGNDRVSNRQLYETLIQWERKFPSRREMYLAISSALILGQVLAVTSSSEPTRTESLIHQLLAYL